MKVHWTNTAIEHLVAIYEYISREREVYESSYRIIYRVKSQQVDVLAVIHGARLLPPELQFATL